jgi:ferric-dicitrate binding protein FerR (iron transport regulator)
MLDSWEARERFANPVAFSAFLEEAVRQEADIQRRKHAALRHRDGQTRHHVDVPSIDEAVKTLIAELHAPPVDHAQALEEARATKRAHTKEHVERVAEKPRWLLYGGIALVATLAIVGVQRFLDRAGSEVAVDRALKGEDVQYVSSNKGQRGSLTLRDGTRVTMGSETRMTIPDEFGGAQRTVQIEGTATFIVTPSGNPNTPAFAVRAGSVTATATGTVFTVRRYLEDSAVVVQVTEGSVSVKDKETDGAQVVNAGEAVRFANGAFSPLTGVARDVALAWTRDSIVFDNAPLKTVVPELVRWFGMNAALVDNTVGDRPVSMRVALNSSGDATKALTAAADLAITFGKDDRIEFTAAPVKPSRKP